MSLRGDDELPAELVDRERDLRFLDETRSGRRSRRGGGAGGFPPYVAGCPEHLAVGAAAAVAAEKDADRRPSTEPPPRRSTIAEMALSRYGDRRHDTVVRSGTHADYGGGGYLAWW